MVVKGFVGIYATERSNALVFHEGHLIAAVHIQ